MWWYQGADDSDAEDAEDAEGGRRPPSPDPAARAAAAVKAQVCAAAAAAHTGGRLPTRSPSRIGSFLKKIASILSWQPRAPPPPPPPPRVSTAETYAWQEHRGPFQMDLLKRRKTELQQADLAGDGSLLIEWFALIQQMDLVIRSEMAHHGYRPRSHSLPLNATRLHTGHPDEAARADRRPRSGTFQPGYRPVRVSDMPLIRFDRDAAASPGGAKKETLDGMKERLAAKDRELRQMQDRLQQAMRNQRGQDAAQEAGNVMTLPQFRTRSVTIVRDEAGSFGIQVKPKPGVRFGKVRISGVKGRPRGYGLKVGDVVFEVEGEYLLEATHKEVVTAIKGAGEVATFVVANAEDVDSARFTDARDALDALRFDRPQTPDKVTSVEVEPEPEADENQTSKPGPSHAPDRHAEPNPSPKRSPRARTTSRATVAPSPAATSEAVFADSASIAARAPTYRPRRGCQGSDRGSDGGQGAAAALDADPAPRPSAVGAGSGEAAGPAEHTDPVPDSVPSNNEDKNLEALQQAQAEIQREQARLEALSRKLSFKIDSMRNPAAAAASASPAPRLPQRPAFDPEPGRSR